MECTSPINTSHGLPLLHNPDQAAGGSSILTALETDKTPRHQRRGRPFHRQYFCRSPVKIHVGILPCLATTRCFRERERSRDLSCLKCVVRELFARIQLNRVIIPTPRLPAKLRGNQDNTCALLGLYTIAPAPHSLPKIVQSHLWISLQGQVRNVTGHYPPSTGSTNATRHSSVERRSCRQCTHVPGWERANLAWTIPRQCL